MSYINFFVWVAILASTAQAQSIDPFKPSKGQLGTFSRTNLVEVNEIVDANRLLCTFYSTPGIPLPGQRAEATQLLVECDVLEFAKRGRIYILEKRVVNGTDILEVRHRLERLELPGNGRVVFAPSVIWEVVGSVEISPNGLTKKSVWQVRHVSAAELRRRR